MKGLHLFKQFNKKLIHLRLHHLLIHTSKHVLDGVVRDREDVGGSLHTLLASVGIYNLLIVHWEPLVGVYSGTEQPGVGLKEFQR
jgi:hypothetical protein